METQKIVDLLNSSENEYSKFATKNGTSLTIYENPIKFLTKSIESSLCDYSDAYALITGNIAVVGASDDTKVAFKNCVPFRKCRTETKETFIDEAEHINITMHMYNLIGYSDNYSDTSGCLWQLKRDEIIGNVNLKKNSSLSFKDKLNPIGKKV